jgi:hypothetical protein
MATNRTADQIDAALDPIQVNRNGTGLPQPATFPFRNSRPRQRSAGNGEPGVLTLYAQLNGIHAQ